MGDRHYLLTAVEFDVLWDELTGGPSPPVLRLASPGRTQDERRRVRAAAWAVLRTRGLADGSGPDGGLDGGLVRRLRALAHPATQLELRACWGDRIRAVAAGRDGVGTLVVRRGDTVLVAGCGSLPGALLSALPPGRPGPGRACAVPTAALAAAGAGAELVPGLLAARVPAAEARLLDRMLGSVVRRAQLVALVESSSDSGLRRRGGVIGVLDGRRGRYLLTRSTAPDGTDWTSVAPCDPRHLRHRVAALLHPRS